MESNKCKNKKCQRLLPEGYKHKYCESCRNQQTNFIKNTGKAVGVAALAAIAIITKGKINPKS